MTKARELAELSRTVSDSADAVAITINASEDVTFSNDITVTGNTGIGGAAHASDALNITSTNQHIRLNNGSELGILALTSNGDLDFWAHGADEKINFRTGTGSGTVAMNVVGTNVGIGTIPSSELHVKGTNETQIYIEAPAGSNSGIRLLENGTSKWTVGNDQSDDGLFFYDFTASSERMRLSGGNLLVGKTALEYDSIAGHVFRGDGLQSSIRDGGNAADFNRLSDNGEIIRFSKDGTTKGRIGTDGSDIYIGSDDTNLLFFQNGFLPANSVGGTRDNASDLGAASARFKDLYLSGGVNFSANANASGMTSETLSDYEHGNWTPTFHAYTGSLPSTFTNSNTGTYTKVGRMVSVIAYLDVSSVSGAGSNIINIRGLPFTSYQGNGYHSVGALTAYNVNFARTTNVAITVFGSTDLGFLTSNNNGAWGWEYFNIFSSGDAMRFEITYYTSE